jgi:hypothetical protein
VARSTAVGAAGAPGTPGAHGSSGTMAHITRYTIRKAPPVKIASSTHRTREIDGSTSK